MVKHGLIMLALVILLLLACIAINNPVVAHSFARVLVDASLPTSGNCWSVAGARSSVIRCAVLCLDLGWKCKGFQVSKGESVCQPLDQNPLELNQSFTDQFVSTPGMTVYGRQRPLIQDQDMMDSAQDYSSDESAELGTEALPTGPTLANVPSDVCDANPCPTGPRWMCIGDDHFQGGPPHQRHLCLYCSTNASSQHIAGRTCSGLMRKAGLMTYNASASWKQEAVWTMVSADPNCTANGYWVNAAGTTQQPNRRTRDVESDNSMEWTEDEEELTGSDTDSNYVNKSSWKLALPESPETDEIRSKRNAPKGGPKRQDSDSDESPSECGYFNGQNGSNFGQLKSTSCTAKMAYICELT